MLLIVKKLKTIATESTQLLVVSSKCLLKCNSYFSSVFNSKKKLQRISTCSF